jgi:outer membrane immunogenic protein
MKRILLASIAAAALWAAPSFAADPAMPMEDVPVFSWTGGYVGIQGGWTGSRPDMVNYGGAVWTTTPHVDSFSLGGVAGYRHQFNNNVVLGLEGDINWISGSETELWAPANINSARFEPNWDASVRVTLGYAVDRWLPYITGGVAFMGWDSNYSLTVNPAVKIGGTETGWTAGGGVAYAFTDNLIVHADYRYADFGKSSFATAGFLGTTTTDDLSSHKVNIGLSYKF